MSNLLLLTSKQLSRAAELKDQIESLTLELSRVLEGHPSIAKRGHPKKISHPVESSSQTDTPKPKRRKMNKAAKAKIAAAQKARWAKFHAEKKA